MGENDREVSAGLGRDGGRTSRMLFGEAAMLLLWVESGGRSSLDERVGRARMRQVCVMPTKTHTRACCVRGRMC